MAHKNGQTVSLISNYDRITYLLYFNNHKEIVRSTYHCILSQMSQIFHGGYYASQLHIPSFYGSQCIVVVAGCQQKPNL